MVPTSSFFFYEFVIATNINEMKLSNKIYKFFPLIFNHSNYTVIFESLSFKPNRFFAGRKFYNRSVTQFATVVFAGWEHMD